MRLDTAKVKLLMLIIHLAAVPAGIAAGIWVFKAVT